MELKNEATSQEKNILKNFRFAVTAGENIHLHWHVDEFRNFLHLLFALHMHTNDFFLLTFKLLLGLQIAQQVKSHSNVHTFSRPTDVMSNFINKFDGI